MQTGMRNRHLVILLAVVLFVLALITWWIFFLVHEGIGDRSEAQENLLRSATLARAILNAQPHPVDPDTLLSRLVPGIVYEPSDGVRGVRDTQASPLAAGEIRPNLESLGAFDARSRSVRRMFLMEGAAFVLVQLIGVSIVYGALRREIRLKRQQENFISAVTHELKSPLTSLELFGQTLMTHDLPAEKRKEILEKMLADTRRLDTLVSNLLDASRAMSGRFKPEPERIDLGESVAKLLDGLGGYLTAHRARVEFTSPARVTVTADRRYLETIFRNLLQNAVKYANGDPVIRIRTDRNGHRAVLVVADEGMGLEGNDQEAIFKKFYRAGDEMVRARSGSGLGLYLAREMAHAMGGDLTAESPGPGKGTTLRVFLPLAET